MEKGECKGRRATKGRGKLWGCERTGSEKCSNGERVKVEAPGCRYLYKTVCTPWKPITRSLNRCLGMISCLTAPKPFPDEQFPFSSLSLCHQEEKNVSPGLRGLVGGYKAGHQPFLHPGLQLVLRQLHLKTCQLDLFSSF
jgi:hypothetical protein